ncbi:MAG: YfhO family protein [Myxococcales bacterium]|nr:YfhO family protein [Myxococcales bacterium]
MRRVSVRSTLEFAARHGWAILAVLVALAFFLPLLRMWGWYGRGDWGYFHLLDEVARRTIRDFGQWPEWNPYVCGGNVLAANTQAHVGSPWVIFPLWLGPGDGIKVAAMLHGAIGAAGALALFGLLGLRGAGRFLATVVFVCSGFFGHQVAGGHVWAWPFYYLPLVLYFFLRGVSDLRWSALAGLFWGLMVVEGGVYPAPYTALLLGLVAAALLLGWTPLPDRGRAAPGKVVAALGVAVLACFLVGATKLLPSLLHVAEHPRDVSNYDRVGLGTLLDGLVARHRDWGWDRHSHHNYRWWGEYGIYVGWATLALAAGAAVFRFRRARVPLLLLALSLAVALGNLGPWAPWSLLHRLPVWENLRVPTRFGVFTVLVLAFLAGLAITEGERRLRGWLTGRRTVWVARLLPAAVALGVAADVAWFNTHKFAGEWIEKAPDPDDPPAPMVQSQGTWKRMYDHPAHNRGSITCQEPNPIPKSPRVRPQAREYGVEPPDAGTVRLAAWSPNRIDLDVELTAEARVWVNQNHHDGWSIDVGRIDPIEGQLAARLPAGRHRVRFDYRAPGLRPGLALTTVGLLGIAGWFAGAWWRDRRRKRRPAAESSANPTGVAGEARTAEPPRRWTPAWWRRVVLPNALFALAPLAVVGVPLWMAEPGEEVWTREVHDHIRAHHRAGDQIQFNPGWVGDPMRRFQDLEPMAPAALPQLEEGGWSRLWYVYCRRDGDERRLRDVLSAHEERERLEIGHYTVYLLEPRGAAGKIQLVDRLPGARARVVPVEGEARECGRRGDGPPLVCGEKAYLTIRESREKIGGQPRRCIWVHPQPGNAETVLTFPGLLAETAPRFTFRYGLTDAAVTARDGAPVEVTVSAGDVPLRRFVARNEEGWHDAVLQRREESPPDLVVTVRAERDGARHFCIGGTFERKEGDGP